MKKPKKKYSKKLKKLIPHIRKIISDLINHRPVLFVVEMTLLQKKYKKINIEKLYGQIYQEDFKSGYISKYSLLNIL